MLRVAAARTLSAGLWHMRTLFESDRKSEDIGSGSKTIWIFSDMMNETYGFAMLALLGTGPERMLRMKANGLVVRLKGYAIHIQEASPNALSPQACLTVKKFWEMYFAARRRSVGFVLHGMQSSALIAEASFLPTLSSYGKRSVAQLDSR